MKLFVFIAASISLSDTVSAVKLYPAIDGLSQTSTQSETQFLGKIAGAVAGGGGGGGGGGDDKKPPEPNE